ncbi:hypothetical protein GCM10009836_26990 [Pseudonocardia ailaonensis]|uniref:DUF2267 domain-containing protein n=1 Tax=Pseudonocardia ailaonensis TaxID=367279 RepID=A0ABN2MZR6_9PSEU
MTDSPMWDVHTLAAGLRADRADVASQARVLTGALAGTLPDGMVEVSVRRSVADRLAGREGRPVAVVVHGHERDLELREGPRGLEAELRKVVRGIVISRTPIGVDEWLQALAEDLQRIAARDAAARAALEGLLGG